VENDGVQKTALKGTSGGNVSYNAKGSGITGKSHGLSVFYKNGASNFEI